MYHPCHLTLTYRADIDGLRAVAVLVVVAYHAFPSRVPGGFIGVDLFFVISGYLISGIILDGLASGRFTLAEFYGRRVRRIFPALAVVLATTLAAGWVLLFAPEYRELGRHVMAGAGFASNFVLWSESGYFARAGDTKPLLHLWSLGIEEQFYLVYPLLLVLAWRLGVSARWLIGILLVASFAANLYAVRLDRIGAFYSPLTRLWELLIGATLVVTTARPRGRWREAGAMIGLALIGLALAVIDERLAFPGYWALLPAVGAWLLLAAGPEAWINRRLLSQPAMVWVGLCSYPLYLWHWPLLSLARSFYIGPPPGAVRVVLVTVALLLAWGTFALIERPIRRGVVRWPLVPVLSVTMAIMFAAGGWVFLADGFVNRPLNRSDAAHFLEYYSRIRYYGLAASYREECDFLDWKTDGVRESLSASCTEPGPRRTFLLWGDSYAQALSLGIRTLLPEDTRLAQVATSGCRPSLEPIDFLQENICKRANDFALRQVQALRPEMVIVAQRTNHAETDWKTLADRLLQLGAARVLIVGPTPQWSPSLPEVVLAHYWGRSYERVSHGLDPGRFELDRMLAQIQFGDDRTAYVSLLASLCTAEGCLATVPPSSELLVVDDGHLSPNGSVFVAARALAPHLPK